MRMTVTGLGIAIGAALLAAPTLADDLTGADLFLCTAVESTECYANGSCAEGEPEDWNIPRFLRLDLADRMLSTTKASGEERSTPMQSFAREGDRILIQGAQTGRVFSIVINEASGLASVGVTLDGHVLSIFAYCTPLDRTD